MNGLPPLQVPVEVDGYAIRPPQEQDLAALYGIDSDPVVTKYMNPARLPPEEVWIQAARAKFASGRAPHGYLAVEDLQTGLIVGRCGLGETFSLAFGIALDLQIVIDTRKVKRGLGGALGAKLVEGAFEQMRVNQVLSVTHPDNTPAVRLTQRLGFDESGLWTDGGWQQGHRCFELHRTRFETLKAAGSWPLKRPEV